MDGKCEGCGADMTIQRTHWDGCHTTHKQCAAFKAGREAGMREAAGLCQSHEPKDFTTAGIITRAKCAEVILSAIVGGK